MQLDAENLINVLVHELQAHHPITPDTAIVGIHTGGAWVAERIHKLLGGTHPFGTLAVTLHRDDFSAIGLHHQKKSTEIDFAVDGRPILLIDDVIHTGRSLRAALNELFDFGRPASVKLACLVDRGGREMPFHADMVGMTMTLPANEELELIRDANTGALRFDIHAK